MHIIGIELRHTYIYIEIYMYIYMHIFISKIQLEFGVMWSDKQTCCPGGENKGHKMRDIKRSLVIKFYAMIIHLNFILKAIMGKFDFIN